MPDLRDVRSLPIAPSMSELLIKNGFHCVCDLEQLGPLELSKEVGISVEEASSVLNAIAPGTLNGTGNSFVDEIGGGLAVSTAKDHSLKTQNLKPIITFCKSIDTMLGGGIPMGQITEVCGIPGVGKTQLVTQLALDVQIPRIFAGNEGETIYIDSEGSFHPERAEMMAAALSEHLAKLATQKTKPNVGETPEKVQQRVQEKLARAAACTSAELLDGIHVFRVHQQSELVATINLLPRFLEMKPKVKLIVIDSRAFHFRQDLKDMQSRQRLLSQISQQLNEIAYKSQLAVVVTNHVTNSYSNTSRTEGSTSTNTNSGSSSSSSSGQGQGGTRSIIPALGEHWSHCITNRIMLGWDDKDLGRRRATLVKSPTKAMTTAVFLVVDIGVRDVPKPAAGVGDGAVGSDLTKRLAGGGAGSGPGAGTGPGSGTGLEGNNSNNKHQRV